HEQPDATRSQVKHPLKPRSLSAVQFLNQFRKGRQVTTCYNPRMYRPLATLLAFCVFALPALSASLPPDADRQLAREIYKNMIEIRSGYTSGATTPGA